MKLPIRPWSGQDDLSDLSVAAETARLKSARPVAEFERILNRMWDADPEGDLAFEGEGKSWREAWTALALAKPTGATHLQLAENGAADDFYMKPEGRDWQEYQATVALLEGRHPIAEFRAEKEEDRSQASGPGFKVLKDGEMERQSAGAIPAIVRALEQKANKGHRRLAIYWNTGWIVEPRKITEQLQTETERFRGQFGEAWIVGKQRSLFRVAPDFTSLGEPLA